MHRRVLLLERIPESTPKEEIDEQMNQICDDVSNGSENTWTLYDNVYDICLDSTTRKSFLSREEQYGDDAYSYLEVHIYD